LRASSIGIARPYRQSAQKTLLTERVAPRRGICSVEVDREEVSAMTIERAIVIAILVIVLLIVVVFALSHFA
jgi:Trk-type K+ transport system membrane component